ncbi:MAG: S-layer homology domain-containing protein [Clostridia bacterium]|nr:S-layer homology domain-containing protein [Clostridia bacterium]
MKKLLTLFLAAMMLVGAVLSVTADESPFSDVKTSRWSYKAIVYAYENGLMDGIGGGKFDPAGTMTRGMVVTVLYRMEKTPPVEFEDAFTDVKAGKYYSDAVIWAKSNNIVNGVSEGVFDPGGKITREQLATMLYRYADFKGLDTRVEGDLGKFPDADKAHSYAKDALIWATSKGLITGVKSGDKDLLDPRGNATREQFATILMRFDPEQLKYPVEFNDPVIMSHYTEKEYPLVTDADIYVATDGDDSNTGDFDHPFATFARAVDEVRALRAAGEGGIVVAFKAGVYFTDKVTMGADVSGTKGDPVVYCAYGDGDAIITGGAVITEDDFTDLSEEERGWFQEDAVDDVKKADLGGKMASYTTKDILFGDDGVMTIARFPNKYADGTDYLMPYASETVSDHHLRINQPVLKRRVNMYHTVEGLQLYGYITTGWYKDILDTDGYTVDEESGGYDFYIPHPEKARMGTLRYNEFPWWLYGDTAFQNISEELDAVGEYWVDPNTMTLYVYKPAGTYTFPSVKRGIDMHNCDYVTFRGLTMTSYSEHIVKALECSGTTFELCKFSACSGTTAVYLDGNHGDLDFDAVVSECDFSVFAGRPFSANGYNWRNNKFSHRSNVLFDNNRVSLTNIVIDDGCAVEINYANEPVVSHNEFVDCSRGAIDYGGCCNLVVEYNTFKHCMYNSSDGGVLYAWNRQYDWGNVVRYNVFFPDNEWYGLYIDDDEPGTEIYGNLFMNSTVCIHNGRSNYVHDNAMINSSVQYAIGSILEALDGYNATGDTSVITGMGFYKSWVDFFNALNADPDLKEAYFSRYPELVTLTTDLDKIGEPEFVLTPRNYVMNNYYFTKEGAEYTNTREYNVYEGNKAFALDENPIFVNPYLGDYRIKEGSEFPDIHFEKMGRY